jgi:Flp pilus assembly protein TadB
MGKTVAGHEGNYDAESARILREQQAQAVIVIVAAGRKGFGFSVSFAGRAAVEQFQPGLPAVLREVARAIEAGAPPDGLVVEDH